MLNEIITIGNEEIKISAHSLILPDVRVFIPFIEEHENCKLIPFCYNRAEIILEMIRRRSEKNVKKETFQFEIPDLWEIVQKFPNEEKRILMSFWVIYVALVQHFLPDSEKTVYRNNGINGKRFKGVGWYSPNLMRVK